MRYVLFAFLILAANLLSAQRPTGLLVSDEKYREVALLPTYSGAKYNEIPLRVSLKKFCPVAGDQGDIGSCVGWAVGYGAMTILRARLESWTDAAQITSRAHSAAFVFNQVRLDDPLCQKGAYIEDALRLVQEQGDCLESTFNFNLGGCAQLPSLASTAEASQYRISDYAAVFEPGETGKSKVGKVCKILASQTPVVVGLGLPESFWNIQPGQALWDPSEQDTLVGFHAMVLVGYDNIEKRFDLFNSFGPGWGQGGFIRIPFDDFERLCRYAYVLVPEAAPQALLEEVKYPLTGEFAFRRPVGYLESPDGREIPFFEEVLTRQDAVAGAYRPVQGAYPVGEAFQLVARQIPEGRYVYVFSQGPESPVRLHFPKEAYAGRTADFVLGKTAEIILPSEETALQLSSPGVDYLCVLYSYQKIPDIETRIAVVESGQGAFADRVAIAFADLLIPAGQVRFDPYKMSFQATARPGAGQVAVSLILEVQAQ